MIVAETKIRARYADTDQMKMVYYATFFEYFEQGRADLLRQIGMPYSEIEHMGYFLPVREAYAKYQKPVRFDDEVIVKTMMKELPQARVRVEYEMIHSETKELLAEGYTVHGFVNAVTGKPARAPVQFLTLVQQAFDHSPIAITS